jgi:hypothetical protein
MKMGNNLTRGEMETKYKGKGGREQQKAPSGCFWPWTLLSRVCGTLSGDPAPHSSILKVAFGDEGTTMNLHTEQACSSGSAGYNKGAR